MPVIKDDEICGYLIGGDYVCRKCVEQDEADNATLNELLLQNKIEAGDDGYYCIRCGDPIKAL